LTEMTKVIVGERSVTWLIHERPLMEISGFARIFLSWPSHGMSPFESIIKLPFEDPETFEHFVRYVYSREVAEMTVLAVLKLYTLAFRLQAPSLCEFILRVLKQSVSSIEQSDVQYIMNNITLSNPLRLRCLIVITNSIFRHEIDPDSLIAADIYNKHAIELLS
ncbi:uncharacterized protein A1O9_03346, partial [Exophiala aquamarina CBS 119918]